MNLRQNVICKQRRNVYIIHDAAVAAEEGSLEKKPIQTAYQCGIIDKICGMREYKYERKRTVV